MGRAQALPTAQPAVRAAVRRRPRPPSSSRLGRWAALAQRHRLTLESPDIPQLVPSRRHPARCLYRPAWCRVTGPRRSRCAWRSSSGATTRRASSFCRAVGWSSAPSPGSDATGVSPRTSRTLPKPWAPSLLSPPSSLPSGGLPGRRSPTQQTAGLHGTVVKVCKSDREGTVAGMRGNGEVAPKAGIKASVLFVREDHLFGSRPDRVR
jgi:hypothetical protein